MHINYASRFRGVIDDSTRDGIHADTAPCAVCGTVTYWRDLDTCGTCTVRSWQQWDRRGGFTTELVESLTGLHRHEHPRQFSRALAQFWAMESASIKAAEAAVAAAVCDGSDSIAYAYPDFHGGDVHVGPIPRADLADR